MKLGLATWYVSLFPRGIHKLGSEVVKLTLHLGLQLGLQRKQVIAKPRSPHPMSSPGRWSDWALEGWGDCIALIWESPSLPAATFIPRTASGAVAPATPPTVGRMWVMHVKRMGKLCVSNGGSGH